MLEFQSSGSRRTAKAALTRHAPALGIMWALGFRVYSLNAYNGTIEGSIIKEIMEGDTRGFRIGHVGLGLLDLGA